MSGRGYARSFELLGYKLEMPRTHWSAVKEDGVCISLWKDEMKTIKGIQCFDSKRDCDPIEEWNQKVGHKLRVRHLDRAWNEFDRWIDVVIRQGGPNDDNAPTDPWERKGARQNHMWRLQSFEPATGHFSAAVEDIRN